MVTVRVRAIVPLQQRIIFMKFFNLKQVKFDPNTIGGLMFVNRILNWGAWEHKLKVFINFIYNHPMVVKIFHLKPHDEKSGGSAKSEGFIIWVP